MTERITRHQMIMGMAEVVARRSTCSRSQVGAIVALESRPLVSGYNGAPSGMPHCNHDCTCSMEHIRIMHDGPEPRLLHKPSCPKATPCTVAVHAEANAIAYAARHGIMLAEAVLYTTMAPCYPCAQLIVNAGIVEVVYSRQYRDVSGLTLLEVAGVRTCQQTA